MSYAAALEQLFSLTRFGEKLDLSTPRRLERALGTPLNNYVSVLVGGTNGKGSTCAFLEAILRAAGLKVGLFTSPHLMRFTERIRIDGEEIAPETVATLVPLVFAAAEKAELTPSFFEMTWGMAALAFAWADVDVVIWEVGLGGRLDATNVCSPVASAVTSLGMDHMAVLGDTLDAIAREKAGIFRPGGLNFTACSGEALAALSRATSVPIAVVAPQADLPPLPLPGPWQRENAALALALAGALGVEGDLAALAHVRWPGRMERFPENVFLDCAHNPPAAEALAAWLGPAGMRPLHLIYGAMADKDVRGTFGPLASCADSVTLVTPDHPRAMTAADLAAAVAGLAQVPVLIGNTVGEALASRPVDRFCLVAGSCFLAGEARAGLVGAQWPECGLVTTAR
jgi:dihydrofolate synthase/folylpolyglutamate synthase